MGWVKTDVAFDHRRAVLVLGRQSEGGAFLSRFLDSMGERPEVIERVALGILDDLRPELAGCVMLGIHFDYMTMEWGFVVSHRSLPAVRCGEKTQRLPLVPEEAAPAHVVTG